MIDIFLSLTKHTGAARGTWQIVEVHRFTIMPSGQQLLRLGKTHITVKHTFIQLVDQFRHITVQAQAMLKLDRQSDRIRIRVCRFNWR